jgi:hypothetical protein
MRRTWIYLLFIGWTSVCYPQTKIMLVGNSITEGMGASDGLGFRNDLYNYLEAISFPFSFVGSTKFYPHQGHFRAGTDVADLYVGPGGNGSFDIAADLTIYRPHVIMIHIGTNDIDPPSIIGPYSEDGGISFLTTTISGQLAYFLSYLLRWQNGDRGTSLREIYISQIIDKIGQESRIVEFNAEIFRIVEDSENGQNPAIPPGSLRLVDHYTSFDAGTMLSTDGVHPNEPGYFHMGYVYFQSLRYLPMRLIRASEGEQNGPAGNVFYGAARVMVTDDYGNGVGGVEITYDVTAGDAMIVGSQTVITDSSGYASTTLQLNSEGTSTIVVSGSDLINPPVSFIINAEVYARISGSVHYYTEDEPVPGVLIDWLEETSTIDTTSGSGYYTFDRFTFGAPVTLYPQKERWLDVTTSTILSYDAALTARNAIGLENLNTFETLAADVDGDIRITMNDAAQIARYVVGFEVPETVDIGEWRFLPETRHFDPLLENLEDIDFTGVIVGDVHGGWRYTTGDNQTFDAPTGRASSWNEGDSLVTVALILEGTQILAGDLICDYDQNVLTFTSVALSDPLNHFEVNSLEKEEGCVKIGLYGVDPALEGESLVYLNFIEKKTQTLTSIFLHDIYVNDTLNSNQKIDIHTGEGNSLPDEWILMQNYPNPFNANTCIRFYLPASSHVEITVMNNLGQRVVSLLNENRDKGIHEIDWHGTDINGIPLSSGCYLFVLSAGHKRIVRKMELVR